jgi:surfactin synthase thioesterase subunit
MDALASYRRSQGLSGLAINWGAWASEGMAARLAVEHQNRIKNSGINEIAPKEGMSALDLLLTNKSATAQVGVAGIQWQVLAESWSGMKINSLLRELLQQEEWFEKDTRKQKVKGEFLAKLEAASNEKRQEILTEHIRGQVAQILGLSSSKLPEVNVGLMEMGFDSLMNNELRNWIASKLNINFTLLKMAKSPTIIQLSNEIMGMLEVVPEGKASNSASHIHASDGTTYGVATTEVFKPDTQIVKQVQFEKVGDLLVSTDKWVVALEDINDDASYQIICMHPMGGEWDMYVEFMLNPPEGAQIYSLQQPMRGAGTAVDRSTEKQYVDQIQLAKAVANIIKLMLNKPTLLWGHCHGGTTLWDAICLLKQESQTDLNHLKGLVLCGTFNPSSYQKFKDSEMMQQGLVENTMRKSQKNMAQAINELRGELIKTNKFVDDENVFNKVMSRFDQDIKLIEHYCPNSEREPIDVPILGFASDQDPFVSVCDFEPWEQETTATFEMEIVKGDHWFLSRNRELITKRIEKFMQRVLSGLNHQGDLPKA